MLVLSASCNFNDFGKLMKIFSCFNHCVEAVGKVQKAKSSQPHDMTRRTFMFSC